MRAVVLCLALSMCMHPDAYCRGEITGETLREKAADALDDCAPMIRMIVEL